MHIRAGHLHLFPALLATDEGTREVPNAPTSGEVREAVERLREDHDFFMRRLAEAVNNACSLAAVGGAADAGQLGAVQDIVLAVAARLAEHNRIEEGQIYLWPRILLGRGACAEPGARMKREIGNLPPRFSEGAAR